MTNKKILTLISFLLFLFLLVGCIPKLNQSPEITSEPVTTATVGVIYTYKVVAIDPNSEDVLTYSLTTEPGGMLINGTSGVITWTPTATGNFPVTVKVSDEEGLSNTQSFTITVSKPMLTGIEVDPKTMTLFAEESKIITSVTAYYSDGSTAGIVLGRCTYTSSATNVAKVSNGVITAIAEGTVTITVTYGGMTDTLTVTVRELEIELTGIEVNPKTMILFAGESEAIKSVTATFEIRGYEVPIALGNCTYASSATEVATASNGVITAIADGTAIITATYGGKSDTLEVTVNPVLLTSIVIDPKVMTLSVGETEDIVSVTAHYNDGTEAEINLDTCDYGSDDEGVATVSDAGLVTAIAEGTATITVGYEGKTDTLEVVVSAIVYRALCVGVGDYENFGPDTGDLLGPPYDVDRIIDVFNHCKFGTEEVVFSTPVSLKDLNATKTAIISGIASTFSGADGNDISYFYFSGHGTYGGSFTTSYICPTDADGSIGSVISVDELESYLSSIPGTKVVILDSCFSGGFIGKGKEEIIISKEELISFNDEIINVFSQAGYKELLTTNQYKVLTSCHYYQVCYEILPVEGDPFGLFTIALCTGCGYYGSYPADTNLDTKVSLQEAYIYVKNWVQYYFSDLQDVQVYPNNSTYPIVEY